MDVGGVLTVTLSDAKTRNDRGMAVLAKQMDTNEQAMPSDGCVFPRPTTEGTWVPTPADT